MARLTYVRLTIAVAVLVKVVAYAVYGPVFWPDSADYVDYADRLLRDSTWIDSVGAGNPAMPLMIMRMIGYPLIIAITKLLAGNGFASLLIFAQCVASLGATVSLYALARRLLGSEGAAATIAIVFAVSLAVKLDLSVLPDSLFTSLFIILLSAIGSALLSERRFGFGRALSFGVGVAVLILLRANGMFVALALAPLAIAAIHLGREGWGGRVLLIAALVVPPVVTIDAYRAWNEHRAGTKFLSVGGSHVFMQPLFKMVRAGTDPFDGNGVVDRMVRKYGGAFRFQDIGPVLGALHREARLTPHQIARATFAKYREAALAYPVALAGVALRNYHVKAVLGLVNPVTTAVEIHQTVVEEPVFPPIGQVIDDPFGVLDAQTLPLALAYAGFGLISLAAFVVFLLGTPALALRRWRGGGGVDRELLAVAGLWFTYVAVAAMYSAVHLELRYIVCVWPIPSLLGLYVWRAMRAG